MKHATLILLVVFSFNSGAQEIYHPLDLEPVVFVEMEDPYDLQIVEGAGYTVRARYEDSQYGYFLFPSDPEAKGRGWDISDELYGDAVSLERRDVTGDGEHELILYWQSMNGRSSWQGGHSYLEEGFLVIDLEKERILYNDYFFMETEMWWNEVDWGEDEDDEPEIIDSGGEYTCESFLLEFDSGTIYFQPDTASCEEMEQGYFIKWMETYDAFEVHYPWE